MLSLNLTQIHSATQIRIDLEALSRPIPSGQEPTAQLDISDDARWEVMSQGDHGTTTLGQGHGIQSWAREVADGRSTDVQSDSKRLFFDVPLRCDLHAATGD